MVIALLAALGQEAELAFHVPAGLNHGLTREEIEEIMDPPVPVRRLSAGRRWHARGTKGVRSVYLAATPREAPVGGAPSPWGWVGPAQLRRVTPAQGAGMLTALHERLAVDDDVLVARPPSARSGRRRRESRGGTRADARPDGPDR